MGKPLIRPKTRPQCNYLLNKRKLRDNIPKQKKTQVKQCLCCPDNTPNSPVFPSPSGIHPNSNPNPNPNTTATQIPQIPQIPPPYLPPLNAFLCFYLAPTLTFLARGRPFHRTLANSQIPLPLTSLRQGTIYLFL